MHDDGIIEHDDDGAADAALQLRREAMTEVIQSVLAANGCHRNEKGFFVLTDEALAAIRKGAIQAALIARALRN